MTKRTHLAFTAGYGQRVERRYRREGQRFALVTLAGLMATVFCSQVSSFVGFVLRADIHPTPICIFGVIVFFWGCLMLTACYFRSTEDLVQEDPSDRRWWYRN
jgi:Na+/melibiose symporter-like transporter